MNSNRKATYNLIGQAGIIPVFSSDVDSRNETAISLCESAGYTHFEFTVRSESAAAAFRNLVRFARAKKFKIILGVGTVSDLKEATTFIGLGAQFVVGPFLDLKVASLCRRKEIPYCPGCTTPGELNLAFQTIASAKEEPIVKVFPADCAGGPGFVKAVMAIRKGKTRWRLMPTGGVNPDDMAAWFKAGVVTLGIGSNLLDENQMDNPPTDKVSSLRALRKEALRLRGA